MLDAGVTCQGIPYTRKDGASGIAIQRDSDGQLYGGSHGWIPKNSDREKDRWVNVYPTRGDMVAKEAARLGLKLVNLHSF